MADDDAAKRHEAMTQLVLRRTALSPSEVLLLRSAFPAIFHAHHDQVWNQLRRRGLDGQEAKDLLQEVFLALHRHIIVQGFPEKIPALLRTITENKLLNHVRAGRRTPVSLGLPSSGSEKPVSAPDISCTLPIQELAIRLFHALSPEHQDVVEKVLVNGLSHHDAAAALGLPEGTLKSRLIAAKREMLLRAAELLPPNQRRIP